MTSTRERTDVTRSGRRRLTVVLGALAAIGICAYAAIIANELRQASANFDRLGNWAPPTSTRSVRPSRSAIPEPSPTAEPPAAPRPGRQSQTQVVEYDRGGDPIDPAPPEFSVITGDGIHTPLDTVEVAEEHLPPPPANRKLQPYGGSGGGMRAQLETRLADDPAALEMAQQLLADPDPTKRTENLQLLRDTLGIE